MFENEKYRVAIDAFGDEFIGDNEFDTPELAQKEVDELLRNLVGGGSHVVIYIVDSDGNKVDPPLRT